MTYVTYADVLPPQRPFPVGVCGLLGDPRGLWGPRCAIDAVVGVHGSGHGFELHGGLDRRSGRTPNGSDRALEH